ncbi:hypothetical protein [Persicobacter diffluens]|uniref:Uncharacterized protein n=1 Tax=Persicobacter diffluens TaxID=981 RepID=A0AAN5AJM9_9BACT|nr:hypothetical protein PEDI_23770 [Persicobacter diffluens]
MESFFRYPAQRQQTGQCLYFGIDPQITFEDNSPLIEYLNQNAPVDFDPYLPALNKRRAHQFEVSREDSCYLDFLGHFQSNPPAKEDLIYQNLNFSYTLKT